MILLDLVIAGVGRFAQPTKFSFHKGYTVIFGLNETGKTTIARVLMAVFFPEAYATLPDFINWALSGTSRAYVTLREGNEVYRLTRDFSQKLSNLARYIPDKKTFTLVSKDTAEIGEFLSGKLGLFDEEISSSVIYSDFSGLPSSNPFGVIGAVPRPVATSSSSAAAAADGDDEDPALLKERLGVLKQEMARAKDIDTIQSDLDDLNGKLYDIQAKLKEAREIDAKLAEMNEFVDRSKALGDMTGIKSRLDRYVESERRRDTQLAEIKSRRGQAEAELTGASLPSIKDNKYLFPGVGIAVGCIIVIMFKDTITRYVPMIPGAVFTVINLGILIGLGVAAWGVWQFISAQNYLQNLRSVVADADADIRMLQSRFESETKDFREVMRTLGAANVEDLKAKISGIQQLKGKQETLLRRRDQLVKERNFTELVAEEERIQQAIGDLEAKLESVGTLGYTPQEMRDEIKRIEGVLGRKGIVVSKFEDGSAGTGQGFGATRKASRFPPDHFSRLIAIATELVQKGRMDPLGELQKDFDRHIQTLSDNNYARSSIGNDGVIKFVKRDSLMRVGLENMSPATKDGMYFSLKLALVGSIIKRRPLPIILDEPFLLLDDKRLSTVLAILKELSAKTQVIYLTARQSAVKGADLSFQIK